MKELIANFGKQLDEALVISQQSPLKFSKKKFSQVYVSGLGGSGIGATIVQDYVKDKIAVPFTVNKSYNTHKAVDSKTLFIACSYSGNTEETLAALDIALQSGAEIVCITSGGQLAQRAQSHKLKHILIPSGMPPRSCLGYSLTQLLHVLHQSGLLDTDVHSLLKGVSKLLNKEHDNIQHQARALASKLVGTIPIIYTTVGYEGIAVRFRQQLNENSKMLCWHNVLPEMTHNEIVGWRNKISNLAVVALIDTKASAKNKKRLKFLLEVIKPYCTNISLIEPKGSTYWQRVFYHIHLEDWISWELSVKNKVSADEIDVIISLKKAMGEKSK